MGFLRLAFWACWVLGLLFVSIEGNQVFTRLAFHWGPIPSLLTAFISGWAYLWVSRALVPPQRRREAMLATVVFIVPLCLFLGLACRHEWRPQGSTIRK